MTLYLGHVGAWFIILLLNQMLYFLIAMIKNRPCTANIFYMLGSSVVAALFSFMAHKFLFGG